MKSILKSSYKLYLIVGFCFVLLLSGCIVKVKVKVNFNLLLAQDIEENKNKEQSKEKVEAFKEPETSKEVEKIDPTKDFRLLAVYLISGEARALIKNLSNQEESPREFKVGDFLDELSTIEISRISLNPTARVELIDRGGFSYLMRTQAGDLKAPSVLPKIPSSKGSLPSYFSSGKGPKHKDEKKKDEKLEKAKEGGQEVTESAKPDTHGGPAVSNQEQAAGAKQDETKTESQSSSQGTSQAIQTTTTPQGDSAGTSRPTGQSPFSAQPSQQTKSEQDLLSRPKSAYE